MQSPPETAPHTRLILTAATLGVLAFALMLLTTTAYSEDPGYALLFDGNNDFVLLHETSQIFGGDGWKTSKTVSMWVKPTGLATCTFSDVAHCDAIFGDRARWWGISRGEVNGLDRIWFWNYDGNYDRIGIEYELDEWIHIALVHDGSTMRAYKFGVEVGSVASGPTAQPSTGAQPVLHIGGIMTQASRIWAFSGEIDEVRLWDYVRTAQQLTADMLTSLNGDESGLMAYYKMSDGNGLTLTDDSGNGWDGTLEDGGGIQGVPPDGHYPEWVTSGAFTDPPPTSTPTATATSTPTHTPTNTPTPTVTGTPPTPSPTITGTPPTPPATIMPPGDERSYLPLFTRR